MKKIIAALAVTTALVLTGCSEAKTTNKTSVACEEDQPCWDCHTMGNKVCGEELPQGVVVLPSEQCPVFQPVCYDHYTPYAKGH